MSRTIHTWKQISLKEEDMVLPNGRKITHTMIQHPGAAVILPITEEGKIVLVNQFRPSLNKWLLELPAGTREIGEDPLSCAQRELEEETGYSATSFIPLGQVTPLAGFCDEIQYLYVAKNLTKTARYQCDEDEVIEVITLSKTELEQYIIEDKLTDAKTIACLSKASLCGCI
ncbi:NUDIX hydrolase [Vibrio sagamiensis]|uniref:GDP-mannose pyrophosphatase n=1 Tax=Vibrio sagamiensis NBRC 104589 TaxID=1219064 RepID=A0A511QF03_9VIBR|nr:NUDIX hydrolase [Vibrio sagamiensis]PNQ54351.1 NUDIX hydrolase [Vibrio agarivorans]GEM75032.1 ADP-ribose pyrophosphatase [Vibrio sagamiensis NBRC 104589]